MSLDFYLDIDVDTGGEEPFNVELWWRNITHNVRPMWRKAGVADALYESDGKQAGELIETLRAGLVHMEAHPAEYEALNPANGWGDYGGALEFLRACLLICEAHPKATVRVSA